MMRRVLYIINRFSLSDSLLRVNKLFFVSSNTNQFLRLQNNFVFRHACMTPLTILSCTLENLETSNSSEELKKKSIKSAREALTHLNKLIMSVTQTESKTQEFEVNKALNEVLLLFKGRHNCEISCANFLPQQTKISGNKLYFQEIIICLLNNAYEAYKDKKIIYISVSVRIIKEQVFIGVVDFAKGMTQLGQRLALLKGVSYKENGLGLGLSFVKQTIKKHFKGVLTIVSAYGVGTHVQIAIPIQQPCNQNPLQS